jgi:hypothetical protein
VNRLAVTKKALEAIKFSYCASCVFSSGANSVFTSKFMKNGI